MDILSIIGLIIGFGAILLGQNLEGGDIETILNPIALMIVLGGTFGAVLLQTPLSTFLRALSMLRWVFYPPRQPPEQVLEKILTWNQVARREGVIQLDAIAEHESNLFAQKGLQLIADGVETKQIRQILENEVNLREIDALHATDVFESMGGYSPTIGIIGAVTGLIHVMGNLADPGSLGPGIAMAFVATIYGVGLANLLFLPISNKLKAIIYKNTHIQLMMIEGFVCVAAGDNPRITEHRLQAYLN